MENEQIGIVIITSIIFTIEPKCVWTVNTAVQCTSKDPTAGILQETRLNPSQLYLVELRKRNTVTTN